MSSTLRVSSVYKLLMALILTFAPLPASALDAPEAIIPSGLSEDDSFFIIFVSENRRNATSSNIADYNTFVNTEADSSSTKGTDDPSITWKALGATSSVTQVSSLFSESSTAPIYNLNGDLVANNAADYLDGSISNAVLYGQSGATACGAGGYTEVWTGLLATGQAFPNWELGGSSSFTAIGNCNKTSGGNYWNDNLGGSSVSNYRVYAVSPLLTVNFDPPTIANLHGDSFSYSEGSSPQTLDQSTAASVSDPNTSGYNGGNLTVTITAGEDAAEDILYLDTSGVVSLAGLTAGSNVSVSGTVIGTLGNNIAAGNDLVINLNANATDARLTSIVQALQYQNTDTTDPTTGARTVRVTITDASSRTSENADVTVTVNGVNDEPTLTATGQNPIFTEGGSAADLFSSATASTVESGQTIQALTFTVTNVSDGVNERIVLDGSTIVLTNGTSGTTATNSLSYSVFVSGSTATVSLTAGTMSTAATQTLINGMSYANTSNDPSTSSSRVVTITSIQDSGGTANGGDDTASLAISSVVSVTGVNDEPTLTATGSNPTFTEGGSAASLFSGANASTIESGQTITALTLTVTNLANGVNERLNIDGSAIILTHGTSGTTATNSLSYSVSVVGSTGTISLTGGTLSTAATQTLVDAISYQNNSNSPNTSNRVVTLISMRDSGGTANGGDNTVSLAIASTVTVVSANDAPTLSVTSLDPTYATVGATVSVFQSASVSTVETGQTIEAITFTITNADNGSSESLQIDGTEIAFTNGASGTTTTNSLSYSVVVSGTTVTIALAGGTLTTAQTATLIDGVLYKNSATTLSNAARAITVSSLKDNGGTANGGIDTANPNKTSTVTVSGSPEIAVIGNSVEIASGDSTPSEADFTVFAGTSEPNGSATRTFTIQNNGNAELQITGSPRVSISGTNASDFSVTTQPSASLEAAASSSFVVTFDPSAVAVRTAIISISNNDSDEGTYTFAISGEGLLDTDADGEPDVTDLDDDNDGVTDAQEILDGTDPLASDSYVERAGQIVCINWNGFLSFLTQIFELRNSASTAIQVNVGLFDINGTQQSNMLLNLEPNQQFDVIANDMSGFVENTYGRLCATTFTGPADAVEGQLLYYRLVNGSFDLAFVEAISSARTGEQYLTSNTFYPTLNLAELSNVLSAFVQIINEEETTQTGTLIFYDQSGTEIRRAGVSINARGRADVDIHSIGTFKTGLITWVPDDSSKRFRVIQNRYYFEDSYLFDQLRAAVAIPAKRATGQTQATPFDTQGRYTVLEITNVLNESVNVRLDLYETDGSETPSEPGSFTLAARETKHIILNSHLDNSLGNAILSAETPGSIIVSIMEYGVNSSDGSLAFANAAAPREGAGEALSSSYNNFLGGCALRVANESSTAQNATLRMTRYDETVLINDQALSLPANGTLTLDLCANETQTGYGQVLITPENVGVVSGQVVRQNSDASVEFILPLNE